MAGEEKPQGKRKAQYPLTHGLLGYLQWGIFRGGIKKNMGFSAPVYYEPDELSVDESSTHPSH